MHNIILKMFIKLRSFIHFLKIIDVFTITMLFLYWTENLIGAKWDWMSFIKPILNFFINIGASVSNSSVMLFSAVFEFKYFIAFLLLLTIYIIFDLCIKFSNKVQDVYELGHEYIRKSEEDRLNKALQKNQTQKQKKLQKYMIFINAAPKTDTISQFINIDIEEQKKVMNKFLIEQTGVMPKAFDNGFLYEFPKFDDINSVLPAFFKVLHSENPINYQVCIAICETASSIDELKKLISLSHTNKITMFSDVAYRYRFVESQDYETSMIGVFKNGDETFEVHEFINNI